LNPGEYQVAHVIGHIEQSTRFRLPIPTDVGIAGRVLEGCSTPTDQCDNFAPSQGDIAHRFSDQWAASQVVKPGNVLPPSLSLIRMDGTDHQLGLFISRVGTGSRRPRERRIQVWRIRRLQGRSRTDRRWKMDKTAFSQAEKETHARSLGKLSVGTAPSQISAHTARNLRACYLGAVLSGCRRTTCRIDWTCRGLSTVPR